MSINPSTQYPTKTAAPSASYPYGAARNITVPGDGTGTPWEAAIVNDLLGFQQALLSKAGITPTGAADTALASQYLDSIKAILGGNVSSVVFADSPKTLARMNSGLVLVDATAGNIIINLPAASILSKLEYEFYRLDSSVNSITINRAGADTIDGDTSFVLGIGDKLKITSDGTSLWASGVEQDRTPSVDVTQATGALTIAAQPFYAEFRSTTLTNGKNTKIRATPANLVIPDGATLGGVTTVAADIVVLILNNAGTAEFAVVNLSGGVDLSGSGVISTTAIGTGSDSAGVVYSTTARTNVAYKVVKRFTAVNTAGTWASPTAVADLDPATMASAGFGQTWQDLTVSRAKNTTYYNTTGKEINAFVRGTMSAIGGSMILTLSNGVSFTSNGAYGAGAGVILFVTIPHGESYAITEAGATLTLGQWREKR